MIIPNFQNNTNNTLPTSFNGKTNIMKKKYMINQLEQLSKANKPHQLQSFYTDTISFLQGKVSKNKYLDKALDTYNALSKVDKKISFNDFWLLDNFNRVHDYLGINFHKMPRKDIIKTIDNII